MKYFTVSRKKWKRGGANDTSLLTETGQKCCLGFVCKQVGAKTDSLYQVTEPCCIASSNDFDVFPVIRELVKLKLLNHGTPYSKDNFRNSEMCRRLIDVNDNDAIRGKEREKKLNNILKQFKAKWRFKFVD